MPIRLRSLATALLLLLTTAMSGDPVPRRAYTQSHVDYVVEAVKQVWDRCDAVRGFRIVEQAPSLRHFTAKLDRCVASLSAI